ncbi:MAG TPA: hypothetical protein VNI52_01435 [Sphingobacteriaceae bacterium]|nr:hypothetical protein [Sphingobacteriaceae bacterium]
MKKNLLTAFFCAMFLLFKADANGQQTQTSNVAVTIATVTELTANNTNLATFAFATGAELEAGLTQPNAVSLAFKSNKITKIQIKAQGAGTFTGGAGDMPVSVISYKKNGTGAFVPLTSTAADLSSSQSKGSSSFGIDYKITPGLSYDPASDYAVTIEYILTPQ